MQPMLLALHWLPVITTILSGILCYIFYEAARTRRTGPHLGWWTFGAFTYGAGTLIESLIAVFGNSVGLTKSWYIAGALLGGFPLAQGAAYLHLNKLTATRIGLVMCAVIAFAAIATILSPVDMSHFEPTRPTGAILSWHWVRLLTPIINLYSFVILVGGAIRSAVLYARKGEDRARVTGNILIAVGGLLPGIGGSLAKAGMVEALYVLELVGLVLIWRGYSVMVAAGRQVAATPDYSVA